MSLKAPEEDKEEMQETTVSLATAANETSVDVLLRNDQIKQNNRTEEFPCGRVFAIRFGRSLLNTAVHSS